MEIDVTNLDLSNCPYCGRTKSVEIKSIEDLKNESFPEHIAININYKCSVCESEWNHAMEDFRE